MAELLEKVVFLETRNFPLSAIAETAIVNSGEVVVRSATALVHIRAWAQLTTGTGATALRLRIGRDEPGGVVTVSETNVVALAAAAGGNETVVIEAVERRSNVAVVRYYMSVEQVGAVADGSSLQACIEVEVLSG